MHGGAEWGHLSKDIFVSFFEKRIISVFLSSWGPSPGAGTKRQRCRRCRSFRVLSGCPGCATAEVKALKKDVDLVVLDTAGPVIKMQALRNGILLHSTKNAYENFFSETINEYDDLKFFRRGIEESVLRRRIYA